MKSVSILFPRPRRAHLMLAGAVGVILPAIWPFAACRGTGECDYEMPCVETCGGPVIEVGCNACPDGLIDGTIVRCSKTCDEFSDNPVVLEACGECPDGLANIDDPENMQTACVETCGGPAVASVCSPEQPCPVGSFDEPGCYLECPGPLFVCLEKCGGAVWIVACTPCEEGFVEQHECLDAGADGG